MQQTKTRTSNKSQLQQLCPNKFTQPSHQNPTSHSYRIYHACKVEDFCIFLSRLLLQQQEDFGSQASETRCRFIFQMQVSNPKHSFKLDSKPSSKQNRKLSKIPCEKWNAFGKSKNLETYKTGLASWNAFSSKHLGMIQMSFKPKYTNSAPSKQKTAIF